MCGPVDLFTSWPSSSHCSCDVWSPEGLLILNPAPMSRCHLNLRGKKEQIYFLLLIQAHKITAKRQQNLKWTKHDDKPHKTTTQGHKTTAKIHKMTRTFHKATTKTCKTTTEIQMFLQRDARWLQREKKWLQRHKKLLQEKKNDCKDTGK